MQRISIGENNCTAIHWIEIYPVDSAIQLLNNRGLAMKLLAEATAIFVPMAVP